MFSYTKVLIALAVAFFGTVVALIWFMDRSKKLDSMRAEKVQITKQLADASAYGPIIQNLHSQSQELEENRNVIMRGFIPVNLEGPKLVQAVVDTAAACGIQMTSAEEATGRDKGRKIEVSGFSVNVVTYRVCLKGSYSGLVKFMQGAAKWSFRHKIESQELLVAGEHANADEIDVVLVMSVFSNET